MLTSAGFLVAALSLSQTARYELREDSLFAFTRRDESGNTERITGTLAGSCTLSFQFWNDEIHISIADIDFRGDSLPPFRATGGGLWCVFSISAPLANRGLQWGNFALTIDGTQYRIGSPEFGFTLLQLPALYGFFGGDSFGLLLVLVPAEEERPRFFARGDVDGDLDRDLTDAMRILMRLFAGGDEITCLDAADPNDDGRVDVTDAIHLLNHLFLGGALPRVPGRYCGLDPTDDDLDCQGQRSCAPDERDPQGEPFKE